MTDFNNRREALEARIQDLEETLAKLKTQLKSEVEREQHAAIDRLEEHLGELENKHANLQDFWKLVREEIADLFGGGSSKTGANG